MVILGFKCKTLYCHLALMVLYLIMAVHQWLCKMFVCAVVLYLQRNWGMGMGLE